MNKQQIKNSADYINELKWHKNKMANFKKTFSYNIKFKKWIFNNIKNKFFDDHELIKVQGYISNKKITNISSWEEVKLKNEVHSKREMTDLKNEILSERLFISNKDTINKELENKKKKLAIIFSKINNLKTKHISNKRYRRLMIKKAKLESRIKDLKQFINNKSAYTKVFLSDDPPLSASGWIKLFLSYALLIFWVAIIAWPIYELVKSTLNNDSQRFLNVGTYSFGFDSFSRLFGETLFLKWLKNTLIIASITSLLTVGTTLLMGYAFSRFRFKGKKVSLITVMLLQMVPSLAALTVFYVMFTLLNQTFRISGSIVLIIIYVGGGIAGNTFIMKGYMDSISVEIDEAAKIDGLSMWQIFSRIIVPLTKPMIALVALWSFIGPFGDYILPGLLLSKEDDFTLARGLRELTQNVEKQDQSAFAAGSIIIAVPISILFISLRKFLVSGITAGGVKG